MRIYLLRGTRLRRRAVRGDEADEHRREAGDEEAQRDRQQHPLEPLSRAELVPGHDAPEAVSQPAAATAAAGAVAAAVIRVADRRRLIDGPAVWHVLPRDVRNLPTWRSRLGRSRSLAESGAPRLQRYSNRAGTKTHNCALRTLRIAIRARTPRGRDFLL